MTGRPRPIHALLGRAARLDGGEAGLGLQTTLAGRASIEGAGLHTGRAVRLTIGPAPPDHGVVFERLDLRASLPARYDRVGETRLCTVLSSADEPSLRVGTVEHLMAAMAANGVDNALVTLDGPEVPITDGSARAFVGLIARAGLVRQPARQRRIAVRRKVRVAEGEAFAELSPGEGFGLDVSIDFTAAAIGRQRIRIDRLDLPTFANELADCRTFTLAHDIDRLQAAGLARGGSLDNAVVVDGATVLNPGGLRRPDEFVRHKALDVIGDLALASHPIEGRFTGHRCGHGLNNLLLRTLLANPANWEMVTSARTRTQLPADRAA